MVVVFPDEDGPETQITRRSPVAARARTFVAASSTERSYRSVAAATSSGRWPNRTISFSPATVSQPCSRFQASVSWWRGTGYPFPTNSSIVIAPARTQCFPHRQHS